MMKVTRSIGSSMKRLSLVSRDMCTLQAPNTVMSDDDGADVDLMMILPKIIKENIIDAVQAAII